MDRYLLLTDDHLVVFFPYDRELVEEVKQIHGAKWDKLAKLWLIPMESVDEARAFADKNKLTIDPQVLKFDLPKPLNRISGITHDGDFIYLSFRYDPVKIKAVKQIPSITWHVPSKAWRSPTSSISETLNWARMFNQTIPDELIVLERQIREDHNDSVAKSRATTDDLEVAGLPLLPYQRAGVRYASNARRTFIADGMGLGKLLGVSSLVLTPDGWIRMGDIKVGMHVTGRNGLPTVVTAVYPQGIKPLYRVTFSDGSSIPVGEEHLWSVRTGSMAKLGERWVTVTTGQMMRGEELVHKNIQNGRTYSLSLDIKALNGNRRLQIPLVEPVHYNNENDNLPLDPYVLGVWLGDGTTILPQVTSMDNEIIPTIIKAGFPVTSKDTRVGNKASKYYFGGDLRTILKAMGVLGNKHIPDQYLRSNPESRLALIQGLMDTDGYAGDCSTEFSTSRKELADGIIELVQSLGGVARIRSRLPKFMYKGERRIGKLNYRINIKLPAILCPFRLQRKIDDYVTPTKYPPNRIIESIVYSHDEEAQCIAVDAEDHLYVTESFIVTHNTLEAIATIEYVYDSYPALVVCPPNLVLNWVKEYAKWLPSRTVATITNRKSFPETEFDVLVVGYSNITHWEKKLSTGFRSLVYDESHFLKTKTAKRSKSAKKIARGVPKDGIVLCLTGTPITNRPAEYASQLDILGKLNAFGGLWGFYRRYCNTPEAPVWMSDLSYKPIGDISVGDEVIGWEGMKGGKRQLVPSKVLAVNTRYAEIVKVTLSSGRQIRCTKDHKWVSGKQRRWDKPKNRIRQLGKDTFTKPIVGASLARSVSPFLECPDELKGRARWLGGLYDGEATGPRISQSKSHNPEVFAEIENVLKEIDISYSYAYDKGEIMGVYMLGGRDAHAKFLSWCKPIKTSRLIKTVLGANFSRDDIVSVEDDGYGAVVSMTTSTGNYFAWGYASKNCNAHRDRYGIWDISGNSNLDELNERLRGNCYIRRTKEQVLDDLPPVRHAVISVEGQSTAMAEYDKAERDIIEYLVQRAKAIAVELGKSPGSAAVVARMKAEAAEHLIRISVLRRLAARAKMDSVVEFIESHVENGLKVVVAAHHRDIVSELADKFGGIKIQGGMSVQEVEDAKSRFQEESCEDAPVIVLSIQAAKTGHTLTASQDVLFVELPWTPADIDQVYSRCHRLGQKGSVTATYLLCAGTVDEEIYGLIEKKRGVVDAATEGGQVARGDSTGQALVGLFVQRGLDAEMAS